MKTETLFENARHLSGVLYYINAALLDLSILRGVPSQLKSILKNE